MDTVTRWMLNFECFLITIVSRKNGVVTALYAIEGREDEEEKRGIDQRCQK